MTRRSSKTSDENARAFDLEVMLAVWEVLKAKIAREDPTVKDPGQLAADMIVEEINDTIQKEKLAAARSRKRVKRKRP